jgi:O-antigen ligase
MVLNMELNLGQKVLLALILLLPLVIIRFDIISQVGVIFICILFASLLLIRKDDIDFDLIINNLLMAEISIMPLLLMYIDYDATQSVKYEYTVIICLIMISLNFLYKNKFDYIKLSDYFLSLYFLIVVISTCTALNKNYAVFGFGGWHEGIIAITCYMFLFFISSKFIKFNKELINALCLSSLIIAFYGIIQFYGFDPIFYPVKNLSGYVAFSTIGSTDFLGSYISLILPIMTYKYIEDNNLFYFIVSDVLFLCMLCTFTRSAWLAFAIYNFAIIYFILKLKLSRKRLLIINMAFIIILFIFNFANNNSVAKRADTIRKDVSTINSTYDEVNGGGSGRLFIWKRALTLIPERSMLGTGPDNFSIAFMRKYGKEVKETFGNITFDKAHNEYLNMAVTTGVPSLICYFALLITILRKAIKSINMGNTVAVPLFISVCGYLIQAFFNISVVSVAPIFWIMLGALSKNSEGVT